MGISMPGLGQRAEQPLHEAGLQVGPDVAGELAEAQLDGRQQVAQEADRVGEDQLDGVGALAQDGHQLVLELDDGLDDRVQLLDERGDQALVRVLDLLQRLVGLVESLLVFLRQRFGELLLLVVNAVFQLLEASATSCCALLRDRLQFLGLAGDVGLDLCLPFGHFVFGFFEPCLDNGRDLHHQRVHQPGEQRAALLVEGVRLRPAGP